MLALGFGRSAPEAAFRARQPADAVRRVAARTTPPAGGPGRPAPLAGRNVDGHNIYRVSTAVLRCHESPTFPGGLIASLSIPWGFSKGDDDLGGYHLVWPRDLARPPARFLACGAHDEALRVLRYLRATQEADGTGRRNVARRHPLLARRPDGRDAPSRSCCSTWLARGRPARPTLPGVLADGAPRRRLRRAQWPGHRQDRWEENAGYTPFTLAVEIAGLLAAAESPTQCETTRRRLPARHRRRLERADRATGSTSPTRAGARGRRRGLLCAHRAAEVPGEARRRCRHSSPIKNRSAGAAQRRRRRTDQPDALALVRFGLRAPTIRASSTRSR